MKKLCSKIFEISNKTVDGYFMLEDKHKYVWTNEMIEGLVEEESLTPPLKHPEDSALAMLFHKTLILPEGYQFVDENGNVINAKKIVLEKKKKEYPKSFWECCKVLGTYSYNQSIVGYKNKLFSALQKLYICRDAYWKIAGEEMGLGRPWELSIGIPIYYIYYNRTLGTIKKDYADDIQGNVILAFPTAKMRDVFYENFKREIEICKGLL